MAAALRVLPAGIHRGVVASNETVRVPEALIKRSTFEKIGLLMLRSVAYEAELDLQREARDGSLEDANADTHLELLQT